MRPANWDCCSGLLLLAFALLACAAGARAAAIVQPRSAWVSLDVTRPPDAARDWRPIQLPAASRAPAAWYRIDFALDAVPQQPWSVYLPYLYGGGDLYLNGELLARIAHGTPDTVVRWERPHLLPIAPALLHAGANQLALRLVATPVADVRLPLPLVGPTLQLLPGYERRLFWTRTMSQFTVLACLVVGTLALFIWWRRREEVLYGLFGCAALLWGVRTLTFVVEVLPSGSWHAWRTLYHGATGGFAIAMLLFAMRLARIRVGRLRWLLLAYAALGPLGYAASGNELLVGRFWTGGLLPIGAAVVVLSVVAAWRRPTPPLLVLCLALALAVLAGMHDYLLAAAPQALGWLWPQAAAHRVFLLHYAADLLLVAMGVLLAARLVSTLETVEQLNRTLESRVADSERALSDNYQRMVRLERRHAALRERRDIMRDLHDGLGSQLVVTLSRAESGRMEHAELVAALRECIADMRLTLDAMSPEHDDFLQAWGSFRFRWQQVLEGAGIASHWDIQGGAEAVVLPPHAATQLLRIVQEALTNVVKHADAHQVTVRLQADAEQVRVEVADDGSGLAAAARADSHGLANMRARAASLGARLQIADGRPGVRVLLTLARQPAAVA